MDLRNVNCDSMCGLSHFRINYALSENRTRFLNTYRLNGLYTPPMCDETHDSNQIWLFNAKQRFTLCLRSILPSFLPSFFLYVWFHLSTMRKFNISLIRGCKVRSVFKVLTLIRTTNSFVSREEGVLRFGI